MLDWQYATLDHYNKLILTKAYHFLSDFYHSSYAYEKDPVHPHKFGVS